MPTDDRDKQFERALARHLRHASQAAPCPDAEILAAYHERTLSLEESAQWKQHIAACARCQELLSLLEETDTVPANEWDEQNVPVFAEELKNAKPMRSSAGPIQGRMDSGISAAAVAGPIATKASVRPKSSRWIVPLGALAASLLIWVGLHETKMAQKDAAVQIALNRPAASPPPPTPLNAPPAQEGRSEPSSRTSAPPADLKNDTLSPKAKEVAPEMGKLNRHAVRPRVMTDQSVQADKLESSEPKVGQGFGAGKSDQAPVPAGASANVSGARQLPPAPSPLPSTAPAATGGAIARNQPESARKKELQKSVTESVEVSGAGSAAAPTVTSAYSQPEVSARNGFSLAKVAANEPGGIIVAGKQRAWRVGAGGKIELTTDSGKSWEQQASPVATDLTAGSASSDKVCWIVGKAGTVLLTTDTGKHWALLNSPIQDDLGGIRAVDASHATIWDLSNRRIFVTSDGGTTWTQAANK